MHLSRCCRRTINSTCQGSACKTASSSWYATSLCNGFLQSGVGAASVPQVAQDHSACQHVASSMCEHQARQRRCLAAAAQLRPAPPHPASEVLQLPLHLAKLLHGLAIAKTHTLP